MILPRRVLFIGAHCDDIELIAGGLLARACFSGRRVGTLVFSDHRGVVDDTVAAQARAEFEQNLDWLRAESGAEIRDHTAAMLPACRGAFESERGTLYAAMEAVRHEYDLVVTHIASDTNQDHRQVAEEAVRVFKAHATLLGGEFPNNDVGGFTPQVFVALTARELAAKIQLVTRYRSQDFGGRPYLDGDIVQALAVLRGSQVRRSAAEAFAVATRVVVPTEDGDAR
jgi:LmbE family N-acetylglucosaminyl deacetylase